MNYTERGQKSIFESRSVYLCLFIFIFICQNCFSNISNMDELKALIERDLKKICIPQSKWLLFSSEDKNIVDVTIIGGGMSGLTAAFALKKEGITNLQIFDENDSGYEGPWLKTARMPHLRSSKRLIGPALWVPSLTFQSWFEAEYDRKSWKQLNNIPTNIWGKYLSWLGQVLNLSIQNNYKLIHIEPTSDFIKLTFLDPAKNVYQMHTRKLILATGREGSGSLIYPDFVNGISKKYFAHTGEVIDNKGFLGKRVAVVGAGASAFDVSATALENGASEVQMIVRANKINSVNKLASMNYPGMFHGYYFLSDIEKFTLFSNVMEAGAPPTNESIIRANGFDQFQINLNTSIKHIIEENNALKLITNKGEIEVDFLVLATGFKVNLCSRPEIGQISADILLWEDKLSITSSKRSLGKYPYLGPHFQFQEKEKGRAPYLKHIYCFNFGAFLSHGLISGDITGITLGAIRLAQGIAIDFFLENSELYLEQTFNRMQ